MPSRFTTSVLCASNDSPHLVKWQVTILLQLLHHLKPQVSPLSRLLTPKSVIFQDNCLSYNSRAWRSSPSALKNKIKTPSITKKTKTKQLIQKRTTLMTNHQTWPDNEANTSLPYFFLTRWRSFISERSNKTCWEVCMQDFWISPMSPPCSWPTCKPKRNLLRSKHTYTLKWLNSKHRCNHC